MNKKQINTIITNSITAIVIILLIFLLFQTNTLKNKIKIITWEDIIDITPNNKTFDLNLFQNSLSSAINNNKNSIVWIYATKNIEIPNNNKSEKYTENKKINNSEFRTIKTLQWNWIIVSDDWYIITNQHVVNDKNTEYTIYLQNNEFNADKIWYDEWLDIAIIKIKVKKHLIPAKIIKFENRPKIWSIVFALKNEPEQKEIITKMGIINSMKQKFKLENNYRYIWLIQNSTAIEPWFSWWPLININGETIGMNTAIDNIQFGASYALPLTQEFVNQTISSIKESGKIIRPYLWLEYEEYINNDNNKKLIWIKVTNIVTNSPSDKAGVKINDIIYGINNNQITYNNFLYQLYTYKPKKNIILNIQRKEFKQDIQINLWIQKNDKIIKK